MALPPRQGGGRFSGGNPEAIIQSAVSGFPMSLGDETLPVSLEYKREHTTAPFGTTCDSEHYPMEVGGTAAVMRPAAGDHSAPDPKEILPTMRFCSHVKVEGLDFGRQLMLRKYNLHLDVDEDHGLITYSQSERCKRFQGVYHVTTGSLGTSVNKFVILLFNEKQDVELVKREWWPSIVTMGDFQETVLRRMEDYEFLRAKIPKGGCTFYLYYVKKHNSRFHRQHSWANVQNRIDSMDNVTDWANVVSQAVGQIATIAISSVLLL